MLFAPLVSISFVLFLQADIEIGNGLPDIRTGKQVVQALKDAGFEVL
jgi:sterol 24-C-methyltransferase